MNELKIFNYESNEVRTQIINEETWFCAKDVCDILELQNSSQYTSNLKENQKGIYSIYTPGGNQNLTFINESGLYKLLFKSRKTEAEKFQDWITRHFY